MLFFELIQVAIGTRRTLSSTPTVQEWEDLYAQSQKQALTGIAFSAISKLPKEQRPELSLSWQWNEDTLLIKENNRQNQKRCEQLLHRLRKDGLEGLILKGQTHQLYYPEELRNLRESGDIDVWIYNVSKEGIKYPKRYILEYCQSLLPGKHLCYIHYDFPVFSDIPVELHIRPSFLLNPIYNSRLQKWFDSQKSNVNIQTICLLHIYKHLFEEGIGLRQLLDYYYIVKQSKSWITAEYARFGLASFAQDIKYVLYSVFDPTIDITECNQERGEFLLKEILIGGNFGKYDHRIHHQGGAIRHAWEKFKHNLRLIGFYPSEVLCEIPFRLYHWSWRTFKLWKLE